MASCKSRCNLIRSIPALTENYDISITEEEVKKGISKLKTGKAADENGITTEHIKYAGNAIILIYIDIFEQMLLETEIPDSFKKGVITPVLKKGKDPRNTENYRGITVTSIHGKIFEYVLLEKAGINKIQQSNLQFGFTSGLSPNIAALVLSEIYSETKGKEALFVTTLDSQKAFDVVCHDILLDKLYFAGIDLPFWNIIYELYNSITSSVKWQGGISDSFPVKQGVRQGGILSTYLYKQYINDLLESLEKYRFGSSLGSIFAGCPTCADDIVLLSDSKQEMQDMIDIVHSYANSHRFQIHPTKSNTIVKSASKKSIESIQNDETKLIMAGNEIDIKSETTHLGLKRCTTSETSINTEERINLARRTLYSLIKSGVHGSNGLNPRTSYKIYQIYVLPRLLYGLESLNLLEKDIDLLAKFHIKTLRQIQSLPEATAKSAVYLLIGALPIQGELHKRQLSLFHSIANSNNCSIKAIAWRQFNVGSPSSFFVRISEILTLYNLPSFEMTMSTNISKLEWKMLTKEALNEYWTLNLREDCRNRSTLNMLSIENMSIGKTHLVWDSSANSVKEVRQSITKARMLTGRYMLQTNKVKFNQAEIDPTCPVCRTEDEDLTHMLTSCPSYHQLRKSKFSTIKKYVIDRIGPEMWNNLAQDKDQVCQLLIDPQILVSKSGLPDDKKFLYEVEKMSRDYCYSVHIRRLNIHNNL